MKLVWSYGWLDLPDPDNILHFSMYQNNGSVKIDAIFQIKLITSDGNFNVVSSADEVIKVNGVNVYHCGLSFDGVTHNIINKVISEVTDDIYNDTCDVIDLTNRFEEGLNSLRGKK